MNNHNTQPNVNQNTLLTGQPMPEQDQAASNISTAEGIGEIGELALDGGIWALTRSSNTTTEGADTAAELVASTAAEAACAAAAEIACEAVAEGAGGAIAETIGEVIANFIGGLFDGL
ncbi:MAG: hypothetical protein FWC92_10065 [Defluviitaleaceae bacterium]|nr:hypothetical protein [Defluviitaleaceae bacterium]